MRLPQWGAAATILESHRPVSTARFATLSLAFDARVGHDGGMAHSKAAENDPFRPPDIPILVQCLHCGQEYDSYLIEWVEEPGDCDLPGFWCCPVEGCSGKGFGFDILPVDPDYRDERGGWASFDEEDDEDSDGDDDWEDEDALFWLDDEDGDSREWGLSDVDAGSDLLGPRDPGDDWVQEEDIPF